MRSIYVIGAGGHGAVVAELADACGYEIAGFLDGNPALHGTEVLGRPVLGDLDCIPAGTEVALGVGDNGDRARLIELGREFGWRLPVLIHPGAIVSPSVEVGEGTVVLAQVAVNARARTGRGCILNTSSSVDHDCVLGDCAHIAPGARLGGTVTVGAGAMVGIGSCVRHCVSIGRQCTIGAGSVVVRDIPDGVIAYGNPARVR